MERMFGQDKRKMITATYVTCVSFSVLSCRSMSVCRICWTIILMPASSKMDILSKGARNSCGKALFMVIVLYLVATCNIEIK